tara:strand:- start:22578 stop:24803 length:2226 start_codon:yes stop_codon:yes gene_type:complete
MSNTFYIDANRSNTINQSTDNKNEWTYKLNTEMNLPKGTNVEVQTSFINKKGITGGSIEIEEDIFEKVSYTHYITECPQFAPVALFTSATNSWIRPTLLCNADTFRGNFLPPLTSTEVKDISENPIYGTDDDTFNGTNKTQMFGAMGGCNQILPLCSWTRTAPVAPAVDYQYHIKPQIFDITIYVPKGTYGIGELGQLIEDQFNGVLYFNAEEVKLIRQSDTETRATSEFEIGAKETFDGQPFNRPFLKNVNVVPRYFQTHITPPDQNDELMDTFFAMNDYTQLMNDLKYNLTDTTTTGKYNWLYMRGNPTEDAARAADNTLQISPFYYLMENYDTGDGGNGHVADASATLGEFYLYQYGLLAADNRYRLCGTTNFSFKYDTEKSGFSINGLHNVKRGMSHDRFGDKNEASGQPIISFKKIAKDQLAANAWAGGTAAEKKARQRCISALNTPETRTSGIMIINWSVDKSRADCGVNPNTIKNENCMRFQDWFDNKAEGEKIWNKTLWAKLGFTFNQMCNEDNNGVNSVYNKGRIRNYGFTTNSDITNDIIPTISTLNNPLTFKPAGATVDTAGFQVYDLMNFAIPPSDISTAPQGMYANSEYTNAINIQTIIADVGGIVAQNLPTLSKHAYYLITCDLCDNYKDNVKKGDILPLLGIVPKSSLSNQDFIVAENQIVQVLSQDKVVNKISIRILNPDLTAPDIGDNSSVVLKITLPNKTDISLLAPKVSKEVMEQQIAEVGN